jgi:tRNA-2-methylthio-N6-dimethylallyladenosine synthase
MKKKRVYIQTIGCQMNVYDSDVMLNRLRSIGYLPTSLVEKADLIIANTCAIREKEKTPVDFRRGGVCRTAGRA